MDLIQSELLIYTCKTLHEVSKVRGDGMSMIPKPSEKIVEKFSKIVGIDDSWVKDYSLISVDHCSALITEQMSLDHLKKVFKYDERVYVGFWRFDGRWVRRKRHDDMNIGIRVGDKVHVYSGWRLADALKITGKEVHIYICMQSDNLGMLLMVSDLCGICIAPKVDAKKYEDISRVARLLYSSSNVSEKPFDYFLDSLSEREAEKLIERLSKELGILHIIDNFV